jgi:lipoprotein signal peptidase
VLAVVALGVAADQALKIGAFRLLSGRSPVTLVAGLLEFRAIRNAGAMLGLGAGLAPALRLWILTIVECGLLGALVAHAVFAVGTRRLELWAVALVAAGGAGNVIDRIGLGFVRDYVIVGVPGLPTAAFNLADVLVVGGAALLLVSSLRAHRSARGVVTALVSTALVTAALASAALARADEAPSPRPFTVRMVTLGGPPTDPAVLDHVAFCRKLGFNALWVEGVEAGRWTKDEAPRGPVVDRAFVRFARSCRERGIALWVSINPVAETRGTFVFSDPDGAGRILDFAKKLRAKAGVAGLVVSFDDQPVELYEFSDIVRFGRSAAPAHIDLVRRVAAGLPAGLTLWFFSAAYCDAHLGDGAGPYSKALLAGLPTLPPSVGTVWTGPRVSSPSITVAGIDATRKRLGGRPLLLYDNFPANDDDPDDAIALILGALRERDAGLRDVVAAYVARPMTELAGSRLSLTTTAAYLADPEAYDPRVAAARAIDALAGPNPDARAALDTQQIEWGGWIDGRNYWPRSALNAGSAGRSLGDPAFVESFTWTADRYPGRMAALSRLADPAFRDDLLRFMERRLVIARAMPLVVEYAARRRAGRADAADVLAQLEAQRKALHDDPDAARILDLFLRAADVPLA